MARVRLSMDEKAQYARTRRALESFAQRIERNYPEANIEARCKRISSPFATVPLYWCSINLSTDRGRFHVREESYGLDVALRRALSSLDFQVQKRLAAHRDARERIEGRRGVGAET